MKEGESSLAASRAIISKRKRSRTQRKKRGISDAPSPVSERSVEDLETELATGAAGANALPALLTHVRPGGNECVRAMHSARRALGNMEQYVKSGPKFANWHAARRSDLHVALARIVNTKQSTDEEIENAIVVCAVAADSGTDAWALIVRTALCAPDARAIETLSERFASPYANLRQTALRVVAEAESLNASYALTLLLRCNKPSEQLNLRASEHDVDRDAGAIVIKESTSLREAYGNAWLRVLGAGLSVEKLSEVLNTFADEVLPRVHTPLAFADSLTRCYDAGVPTLAVAALDGLYYLISKHGLDYPLFFTKLYNLFTPEALWGDGSPDAHARTKRFLVLSSKFLRFGVIPGTVAAAFIKRLVRRALHAPTQRALWCLRLALDILHRHPTVCYLVHRSVSLFDTAAPVTLNKGADPYDDEALDPADCGATDTSLWELDCLRTHISPAVSRLVESFSHDFRKAQPRPSGDVEDYAELTFADVFEGEFRRRAKSTPVAYDAPGCAPGVHEVVSKLSGVLSWT